MNSMAKPIRVTVLAMDPGGSTGIAYFKGIYAAGDYYSTEYGCRTLGPQEHHRDLWDYLREQYYYADYLHLVTESFEFRNAARTGLNLMSREYIGVIKLFYDIESTSKAFPSKKLEYHKQNPDVAKNFVQNSNLKKMKLYQSGTENRHMMDAYRHLFWYLIHRAKIMPEEFLRAGWKS